MPLTSSNETTDGCSSRRLFGWVTTTKLAAGADRRLGRRAAVCPIPRAELRRLVEPTIAASVMRTTSFSLFLVVLCGAPASAGDGWTKYLGLKKHSPRIRSVESFLTVPIRLDGERVCVFPFRTRQGGTPPAPDLSPAFMEAIHLHLPETELVTFDGRPESGVPPWERGDFDTLGAMHRLSLDRSCTLLLDGLIDRAYRTPAGGYSLEATASLYAVGPQAPRLRWRARKRIDWRRRLPANECLLFYAEEVVFDWEDFGPDVDHPPSPERRRRRRPPIESVTEKTRCAKC